MAKIRANGNFEVARYTKTYQGADGKPSHTTQYLLRSDGVVLKRTALGEHKTGTWKKLGRYGTGPLAAFKDRADFEAKVVTQFGFTIEAKSPDELKNAEEQKDRARDMKSNRERWGNSFLRPPGQ